ncbi:ABC transporter substrate-binding protein [Mangrovicoccus algicola]|uniref:ABC transporter substrate-binding protein n=1 Tax=Mangrovicoccus algicola TaxID=2771008 RepID=A0A8J6ZFR4_9RHOB|nr:ABC transporter substrate-binding protein [Mangrovicoccus algicola]MBE3640631.1 ABC transporter substrate-binding protein [Mangrovicoccus algicola]
MRFALTALAAALLSTSALAQDVSGRLVLYTSQPNEDAQATVDAFTAAHPGVEVEWVRDGTTRIMAKLRAEIEAGAPQPDVLLIADSVTMESLVAEDRLMAYPDADVSAYDAGLMDPGHHYFPTKLITTGIIYNTGAEMVPASWKDLLKPEAADSIMLPSPLTSGAAAIHMAAITGDDDLGWDYYAALAEQGALADGGNGGVYKAVAGGEKLYGFVVDFLPIREKAKGAPVEFVFPEEGVSAVTEPVAILSTAQNPDAAKAFVDFLISREGQELASAMGYLPAMPGVTPPEGFPAVEDITLLPFDAGAALEQDQQAKQRFAEIFGG